MPSRKVSGVRFGPAMWMPRKSWLTAGRMSRVGLGDRRLAEVPLVQLVGAGDLARGAGRPGSTGRRRAPTAPGRSGGPSAVVSVSAVPAMIHSG